MLCFRTKTWKNNLESCCRRWKYYFPWFLVFVEQGFIKYAGSGLEGQHALRQQKYVILENIDVENVMWYPQASHSTAWMEFRL